jgi:hypothetical protein
VCVQMGTMLLSMYQSITQPQPLNAVKKAILLKHEVYDVDVVLVNN